MEINPNHTDMAIYCDDGYGPSFGDGRDIKIANNANTTMKSYSKLGYSYRHPQYAQETNEAKTFLAGSHKFQL